MSWRAASGSAPAPPCPPCAVVTSKPSLLEQDPERIEDSGLVVDHQDRGLLAHAASSAIVLAGRKIVKAVPVPGPESTRTSPRWASHRALDDGQAEPAAAGPPGDEGLEEPLADLLRNAGPGVAHLQPHGVLEVGAVGDLARPAPRRDAHRDPDRAPGRLRGVEHQVGHHPVQQVLVALEHRAAALDGDRRVGPAVGVGPDEPNHRDHHRVQVERHELGGPHPGEIEELAQQPAQPVALPDDEPGQEPLVLVGVLGAGRAAPPSSGWRRAGSGSRAPATRSAPPPPPAARPAAAAPALP